MVNKVKKVYYGIIEEIWELDYVKFQIPLLKCRWVHLDHVAVDEFRWTYVNISKMGYMNDPFILANQAVQNFLCEKALASELPCSDSWKNEDCMS
jgi:hypothetical protein